MRKLFTTLLLTALFFQLHATHIVGGDISYTHLGGLDYKVRLKLHRDCGGAFLAGVINLNVSSSNLGQSLNLVATLVDSGVINTYCSGIATTCSNPSSIFPGFQYYIYEATINLPAAASDWIFDISDCCRNNLINNLAAPGSKSLYIYSKLDNLNAPGGFNNSVNFLYDNSIAYSANQTYTLNQAAIDIDGDSLHFSLVQPLDNNISTPCGYAPGYSLANPFGSSGSVTINPTNGSLTFINSLLSYNVIAIKVDEYRNGQLIASTIKDMQMIFMNGGANNLPSLSGINGGSNYYTSLNVCPSSNLTFTVVGSDLDLTDSVKINLVGTDIIGSTLTSNGALQETVTFNWTPTVADIRPQPYLLVLESKDQNCAKQTYGYLIYINQCNSDSVWAGDANADFTVNNYDVLNIGIGNGSTGIVRPSATTNWVAEYCPDWTNSFISGINYKHADCNGDGIINATDLAAITLNYGQIHLKNEVPGSYKTAGLPDLYFDLTGINPIAGTSIQVPVMLGTSSAIMNDIYGIACHFNISNAVSAPISFSNTSSWIGDATNSFLFQKNLSSNNLAMTMVRNSQTNINGFGQIGTLTIPISASAPLNSNLVLNFTDLRVIKNDGSEITDFNVINDTLKIVAPNSIGNIAFNNGIEIYPNPMNDQLTVKLNQSENEAITISIQDLMGRLILYREYQILDLNHEFKLNTSTLSSGNYILKINTSTNQYVQKLSK